MFSLGCRKDPKDLRDIPMSIVLPAIPLPESVDYSGRMTPVRDQGSEGTCVAFASVVGVKEYQDNLEYKKLMELSPRFLYSLCKKFDGASEKEGTYPRVAMKMLFKYGVCPENYWPYQPYQKDLPAQGADIKAKIYRIRAYARLRTVIEMKRSLLVNGPFLAGVKVFNSWFSQRVQKSGLVPLPKKNETVIGGHAVCIVGYDEKKKLFRFKNSWGKGWADKGYGHLHYGYISKYCTDAWSATDLIENPKALVKKLEVILNRYA